MGCNDRIKYERSKSKYYRCLITFRFNSQRRGTNYTRSTKIILCMRINSKTKVDGANIYGISYLTCWYNGRSIYCFEYKKRDNNLRWTNIRYSFNINKMLLTSSWIIWIYRIFEKLYRRKSKPTMIFWPLGYGKSRSFRC